MRLARLSLLLCLALPASIAGAQSNPLDSDLLDLYKNLHAHPELSRFEEHTSALLAAELRKAGYTVTEHVGKYPDGSQAYGVIGILKNGPGPTLLVRADMDALPITEETGVAYASHVLVHNKSGQEAGVMHAWGHDVHTTVLIGTARERAALEEALGTENVITLHPVMGSGEVGIFGLDGKIPVGYFRLGAMYPDRFAAAKAEGKLLPGSHTSRFEPDPQPTLRTGVTAMTAVATALLQ